MHMVLHVSEADLHAVTNSHHAFLGSFVGSTKKARDAIFYSYTRHVNGFAAMLEEEEAADIARHPKVLSVFQNQAKKLHTTHSWDFMLLEKNGAIHPNSIWKKARFGEDTIIANLDTGNSSYIFFPAPAYVKKSASSTDTCFATESLPLSLSLSLIFVYV
ncbi:hypothetical protein Tsubulata_051496 [Turnera subulata]|uniref:Inhibitor I9 domain-containing protein n=1 Tax=Turnera subulata TaxID=218843 RepID=A0A9Q0FGH8_9ROSI|nr:hypothetical protein Tsubulata_012119 [Turnera subulata]KAJ4836735.1 hypothetical protein Tsubulata_051496 [Turnera subulata]